MSEAEQDDLYNFLDGLVQHPDYQTMRIRRREIIHTLQQTVTPTVLQLVNDLERLSADSLTWHILRVAEWKKPTA